MSSKCSVKSCDREAEGRGWCHAHLQRYLRLGDVMADTPVGRRRNGTCVASGCERPAVNVQLCRTHRNRLRKFGNVQAEKPIRKTSPSGHISHGYRVVPVPPELRHLSGGATRMAEHRLVMAIHLGRPMARDETAHHVNGDRLDNRLENLELWSRWQPAGQRVENKIAWALDLLRRYAPEVLDESRGA